LKILLIGTCRIHEPICSISKDKPQILNAERIGESAQYYTHSTPEIKQRMLYFQKDYHIEKSLATYQIGPYPEPKLVEASSINDADVILIEVPSRKTYQYNDHLLQESRTNTRLKNLNSELLVDWKEWANARFKGVGGTDKFDTSNYFDSNKTNDHQIISNIVPHTYGIDETLNDIVEIYNMTNKKAIFVTHINGFDKRGNLLQNRDELIEKILIHCKENNIPCINPTEIVMHLGQKVTMAKEGRDLNHYHPDALTEIGDWFYEQIKLHKAGIQ
tara:strand:+ start:55 stop:876 length:822 start_codon:yes stop_codon:yes gene_type:complete